MGMYYLTRKRGELDGEFRMHYIPTREGEEGMPYLAWKISRNGKVVEQGGKFNPFPLEDAVRFAFSHQERRLGEIRALIGMIARIDLPQFLKT